MKQRYMLQHYFYVN